MRQQDRTIVKLRPVKIIYDQFNCETRTNEEWWPGRHLVTGVSGATLARGPSILTEECVNLLSNKSGPELVNANTEKLRLPGPGLL